LCRLEEVWCQSTLINLRGPNSKTTSAKQRGGRRKKSKNPKKGKLILFPPFEGKKKITGGENKGRKEECIAPESKVNPTGYAREKKGVGEAIDMCED